MTATTSISHYDLVNGVYCAGYPATPAAFEQQYIAVRTREARIYTDEMVAALPGMPRKHPAYKEWMIRKRSAERLQRYCGRKEDVYILEIGCGNGWLSNLLAKNRHTYVTGLDINMTELQQAARIFKAENLSFVYDTFSSSFMSGVQFSDIVFAASIQYFSALNDLLDLALAKLQAGGHIHILDSFFYKSAEEQKAAAARTHSYYDTLGYSTMNRHYFHHAYNDLSGYDYTVAYNPHALWNRLNPKANPFPWIIIQQHN